MMKPAPRHTSTRRSEASFVAAQMDVVARGSNWKKDKQTKATNGKLSDELRDCGTCDAPDVSSGEGEAMGKKSTRKGALID